MTDTSYDTVNRVGEGVIKLIVTVNGGAAIATLGFAGDLADNDSLSITGAQIGFSIGSYIIGLIAALLSAGSMQLFLMFDGDPTWSNWRHAKYGENISRTSAYVFGIAGIIAFSVGGLYSAFAIAAPMP